MTCFAISLYFVLSLAFLHVPSKYTNTASEFRLPGDYLLGGLFDIHHDSGTIHDRPESIDCSSKEFTLSSYRMFQVMRFAVEEINNSTVLLPNVSLGYEMFDYCSAIYNFPAVLNLISTNGSIRINWEAGNHTPAAKVMGVVGPFESTDSIAMAPLLSINLIPMVSYGAASSVLSVKTKYPCFLRTVASDKETIRLIIRIMQHFNWRWIAFLYSKDAYGNDGLELFINEIVHTEICLAFHAPIKENTNNLELLKVIESFGVSVIVVFAIKVRAIELIETALQFNISNKVWIATDTWLLNKRLIKIKGIENIGSVLGVSEKTVVIPGFDDFIYFKDKKSDASVAQTLFCNQDCDCGAVSSDDILAEERSFNFQVYSATYAIAHALHNVLQCEGGKCLDNITAYPYMVLAELKKTSFTILKQKIQFDHDGDIKFPNFAINFWNKGHLEEVGYYRTNPSAFLSINNSKIQWHTNGTEPVSVCSHECQVGYAKSPHGHHKCCFNCEICPNGTYVNITENAYKCKNCTETEWSKAGSTSCTMRSVMFTTFTEAPAIMMMLGALALVALSLAVAILFAANYNTPVVKSAGGVMCFLVLGCLSLSTISVFFYFDKPTTASCIMRFLPFILFYTVCLACFVVRSFQIVCIFKMAAKFPKISGWWMKYNGQWLFVTVVTITQGILLVIVYTLNTTRPYNETVAFPDKIILGCTFGNIPVYSVSILLLYSLCSLCFAFSYMGKDLPKNYNEAKAITFSLLLLIVTWIMFSTVFMIYQGRYIHTFNALAVLCSLYSPLVWYFLPKCYIILFQPHKNTHQYFQALIQSYTKHISTQ